MLITFFRAIVLYIIVLIVMRLMGKREIGQLQPFELAIAIMIADLASIPMTDPGIPISNGIISKDEAGKLHAIRFIGNDAAHDIKVPFKNQIILALKIIEHLLSSKYAMQDEIEKYLEMPLDCYEVFKKFVNKKVLET